MTRSTVSRMAEFFNVPRTSPVVLDLLETDEKQALALEGQSRKRRREKSGRFDAVLSVCAEAAKARDARAAAERMGEVA
jgi:hypothetical protein